MNLIKFKTKQEFVYMTKTKLGETILCDGMTGIIVADIDNDVMAMITQNLIGDVYKQDF